MASLHVAGTLAHENDYSLLRHTLAVDGRLHLEPAKSGDATKGPTAPEVLTLAGRRVPIVSVHDGEPGLLDNLGSIIGVRHESLAVRKHSKCGRPADVFAYHHLDSDAVIAAVDKVLSETALETVRISARALASAKSRLG